MKQKEIRLIMMGFLCALILTGCKSKTTSSNADTPTKPLTIHEAAEKNEVIYINKFLNQGVDIDSKDKFGNTPLHYACLEGGDAVVEFLVSNGANINAENLEGRSPIYSAISEGRKHIVDILLSGGANINTKDHYRLTPLHAAVMFGQPEILEILLSKGADTSTKDSNGKTPLEQAIILSKTNFRKGTVQEEEKWKFEECTKILQKYENK